MAVRNLQSQSFALKTGFTQDEHDTLNITSLIDHQPLTSDPVNNYYFLSLMLTNLIVGLFYRILVFKQIWITGGVFGGRPINLLTGIFEIQYITSLLRGGILQGHTQNPPPNNINSEHKTTICYALI